MDRLGIDFSSLDEKQTVAIVDLQTHERRTAQRDTRASMVSIDFSLSLHNRKISEYFSSGLVRGNAIRPLRITRNIGDHLI